MLKTLPILILSLVFILACKTTKTNNSTSNSGNNTTVKKAFIPHSVGTFWVYEYIDHQNVDAKPYFDTLKVTAHEKLEDGLKVILNQTQWVVKAQGDSIFNYCQGRGGGGFSMPLYHRTEEPSSYASCKGDVMMRATVSKLGEPQTVKGTVYKNCYQYVLSPYETIIVADGVGVIKKEFYGIDKKLATEQFLVNYAVK